jgi:gamma-tubulin complex component 3
MEKYLKIFRHLWQMKHVEGALSKGWMRMAGGSRTFLHVPGKFFDVFRLALLRRALELHSEWHKIRIAMSEMVHFIRQMQAYCHLEVIECSWKVLLDFLAKKEGDLDALIAAHRTYLDRIVKKVLLLSPKTGREVCQT